MHYSRCCHRISAVLPLETLGRSFRSQEAMTSLFLLTSPVRTANIRTVSTAASTLCNRNYVATFPSHRSSRAPVTCPSLWRQGLYCSPFAVGRTVATRSRRPTDSNRWHSANRQTVTYIVAIAISVIGLSYAAVPLYRIFCQGEQELLSAQKLGASGFGGTVIKTGAGEKIAEMKPVPERLLTIRFNADTHTGMRWSFSPQQREIKLVPGETALAFYTATNPTNEPITGMATYNVVPFDAGQYFNKIQCFCFEEQRLNPNEQVDMPVFFYIDPEFVNDPAMARIESIMLSYTFFEAKDSDVFEIPTPTFQQQ